MDPDTGGRSTRQKGPDTRCRDFRPGVLTQTLTSQENTLPSQISHSATAAEPGLELNEESGGRTLEGAVRDARQGHLCSPFRALTQFVLDLHSQVVSVHDDPVFRGRLDWSHHCEGEKQPGGVCV